MNSKNSEASDPQRLLLNLSDKINLTRSEKCVAKTINLNYPGQRGMETLNLQMDHILYQIFKVILGLS